MHNRKVALLVAALLVAAASLAACGSDGNLPDSGADGGAEASSGGEDGALPDGGAPTDDAGADPRCADASPDADIDCTGKCGPVKDPCTGTVKPCGGCANAATADGGDGDPRVCDLETNTCVTPKVTCEDLGAECGTLKNSCGEYLDCPDTSPKGCLDGKECDPDTHKCRDCQPVTCKDLGYECGSAWLGCGEDTPSNYTDCGSCAPSPNGDLRTCNAVFHTCEPACTPKTPKELCEAAKAKKGLECGVISDGCGGTVNCDGVAGFGCQAGESCGVRGIANRCDAKSTPDECVALGKNCGEITSACTGKKIKCGDCAAGEVCNDNGVCGAPCAAKTCDDFAQHECGTFDDGCGSTVTCGTCAGGLCDDTTNTCCTTNTCADTYAGKCGTKLPTGCGQNALDCVCSGTARCTADGGDSPAPAAGSTGLCCAPKTAVSYPNQCGTNLPDGCGKNNVNVSCPSGSYCVDNANGQPGAAPPPGTPGTCCAQTHTCAPSTDDCAPIDNSCRPGETLACSSNCKGGQTCVADACCTPAAKCAGGGNAGGECNVTHASNGCGADSVCTCKGSAKCWCDDHECISGVDGPGACKAPLTCSSYGAGACGTALPNGVGGAIAKCACPNGKVCSSTTPSVPGVCECNNGLGKPYDCSNVPNGPGTGGDACGTFDNGCGGTVTCGCPSGSTCNTSANPNVCCAPAVCPAPSLGSECGTINNGCTTVSCGCPKGAGNENFTCTAGTCTCVKDTCHGRTGPQSDRCGGTLQCGG